MRIFLDGSTGYLGGAVARALVADGHDIVAHVRNDDAAARVAADGLRPVVGDLQDAAWLRARLADVDGAIHTASPSDASSGAFDNGVVDVVLDAFAGSDRPYVHTGGTWVHGSGTGLTEDSPLAPPMVVGWRPAVNERVRAAAARGVRSSVVAPANLYGHGGGLVALLLNGPVESGALCYPGDHQSFANVFVDDAAAAFVGALDGAPAGSYFLVANASSVPMRELATAASRVRGLGGSVRPEFADVARDRLGPLADALLLDAVIDASHAAVDLGWQPTGPALLDDLEHGSYVPEAAQR